MRSALTALLFVAACLLSGCAALPDLASNGGLPIAKTGWQLSGGIDLQKQIYFLLLSKPFGSKERKLADGWAK